jgi:hypothetical protein
MYTIEEARISGPTANYNVSEGAALEFGRENIQRYVQGEVEAAETQQLDELRNVLKRVWHKLTGGASRPSHKQGVVLSVQPEATR